MLNRRCIKIIGCFLAAAVGTTFCSYTLYAGINRMRFNSESSRQSTVDKVLADRKAIIQQLEDTVIKTVNDSTKLETTKSAMLLLGQLHANEAVPLLVNHLTFKMPYLSVSPGREAAIEDIRPPLAALNNIGLPALPQLLSRQMDTDDLEVNDLTFGVLVQMLGPRVAASYVGEAVDNQADATKRQRLIALRDRLASIAK